MICVECCIKLDDAHKFREQCLKSKHLLMDYLSKHSSVSETSRAPNVCLQDCNHESQISVTSNEHFENNYYSIDDCDSNNMSVKTKTGETKNQAGTVIDRFDRMK